MRLDFFLKASKGNNLISKSRAFHNVGAAYTKDLSNNELAHVLLIGETHNKQGSNNARVRIVVLLTLNLYFHNNQSTDTSEIQWGKRRHYVFFIYFYYY